MTKKENKGVLVVGDGIKKYNPVGILTEKAGIKMPDIVATGDLTVSNSKDEKQTITNEKQTSKEKFDKKKIPLPEIGSKFMLNGNEYIVTYINPGNHRFTCEPCKGVY